MKNVYRVQKKRRKRTKKNLEEKNYINPDYEYKISKFIFFPLSLLKHTIIKTRIKKINNSIAINGRTYNEKRNFPTYLKYNLGGHLLAALLIVYLLYLNISCINSNVSFTVNVLKKYYIFSILLGIGYVLYFLLIYVYLKTAIKMEKVGEYFNKFCLFSLIYICICTGGVLFYSFNEIFINRHNTVLLFIINFIVIFYLFLNFKFRLLFIYNLFYKKEIKYYTDHPIEKNKLEVFTNFLLINKELIIEEINKKDINE